MVEPGCGRLLQAIAVMPHCSAKVQGRSAGSVKMRLIFGMILGAALTVGGAYVSDTASKSSGPGVENRPMVNWDVVGRNVDTLATMIKQGWAKLTG
jgi:hypothetical protein